MDRRELITGYKEGDLKRPIQEDLLRKEIDEGLALLSLKEHYGWKLLNDQFIQPAISANRFLTAKAEDLQDTRAEMKAIMNLLSFIEGKCKLAIEGHKRVEQNKLKGE